MAPSSPFSHSSVLTPAPDAVSDSTMMMFETSPLRSAVSAAAGAILPVLVQAPASGFTGSVLRQIGQLRKRRLTNPRLDRLRSPEGVSPHDAASTLKVVLFLRRYARDVNRTAALFSDEASRELFAQLLVHRALGPYFAPLSTRPAFERDVVGARKSKIGESVLINDPQGGEFIVSFEGETIELECGVANIVHQIMGKQYYFRRRDIRIQPQQNDVIIDAGGCYGDTALAMSVSAGSGGAVFTFEPIPSQAEVLTKNLKRNPHLASRITHKALAVGANSGQKLRFTSMGGGSRACASGDVEVETITIDDFVRSQPIDHVDFIKMDIEGAETEALEGARRTISSFKPKLGISVYHSLRDMVFIPQLVRSIEPSYQLYLDHHTVHAEETVLYGIVQYEQARHRSPEAES